VTHSSRRVSGSSRAARLLAGSVLLAGAVGVLAGCSATNPSPISSPYPAGDGTNAEISDPNTGAVLKLRNFLLVGTDKGKPAQLVGAIANEGTTPVQVTLSIDAAAPASASASADPAAAPAPAQPALQAVITAVPGQLTLVGPGGTAASLSSLPAIPGATVTLRAQTSAGGQSLIIPVMQAEGQYASLPPGSPAPALQGTASASAG